MESACGIQINNCINFTSGTACQHSGAPHRSKWNGCTAYAEQLSRFTVTCNFCKRVVYHLQSVEDLECVERHGTEIVRVVFVATEKLSKEDITKISDFVHSSDQIDELSFRQMVNERYETEYYNHDFLKTGHEKGLWHYIRQKDYNIYYAENRIYTKFSEIGEDDGRTDL